MVGWRLIDKLDRPVDAASLRAFRIAFGGAMIVAALRFFAHGWIDADYARPHYFFSYWGLSWLRPLPAPAMHVVYGVIAVSALMIALGVAYRVACAVFVVTFTYAHLCDQSNYLNHYYLISLVGFLMLLLPLDRTRGSVRAWVLWLLRFQIGVVYFFGGIAKIGSDWLLRAEPLRIWLMADAELPLLGHLARHAWFPYAMSWGGMLFDLCIVPLLLWRRTRAFAYILVVVFHVLTALLFKIGMFPWVMIISTTLFFDPSWPRRFFHSPRAEELAGRATTRGLFIAIGIYMIVQLGVPLRHFFYPGNTLWTEEAFRFSWRVMLIEKSGDLELTVVDETGRKLSVSPHEYLTPFQARMVSTQPDMILAFAHMVANDFARRGRGTVKVYAEAYVSFNGRHRALMIDPTVDLAAEHEGLAPKRWILPAPTSAPLF